MSSYLDRPHRSLTDVAGDTVIKILRSDDPKVRARLYRRLDMIETILLERSVAWRNRVYLDWLRSVEQPYVWPTEIGVGRADIPRWSDTIRPGWELENGVWERKT